MDPTNGFCGSGKDAARLRRTGKDAARLRRTDAAFRPRIRQTVPQAPAGAGAPLEHCGSTGIHCGFTVGFLFYPY